VKAAWLAITLLAAAGELAAHATLLRSVPADGARLRETPSAIVLEFDEPVVPIAITLTDATGAARTPAARPAVEGQRVLLALPSPLDPGGYIASYRITSADSHVVAGAIAFAIGDAAVPAVAQSQSATASVAFTAWRALRDALVLALAGIAAYVVLVGSFPRARPAIVAVAGLAVLVALVSIGVTGSELVGTRAVLSAAAWHAGAATPIAWCAALACAGGLAIAAGPGRRALAIAGSAALAASIALSGHALTASPRAAAIASLLLHVAAVGFWLGSLLALLATLHRAPLPEAARALDRFSRIASLAVPAGLAAGGVFAAIALGTFDNLVTSPYGDLVVAKSVAAALLLGLAALNRFVLLPAMRSGNARAARSMRTSASVELVLVLVAIVVAATLARTPPPSARDAASTRVVVVRDVEAHFAVTRASAGVLIEVALRRSDGSAIDAPEVRLDLSHREAGIGPLERTLVRIAPGRYRLERFDSAVRGSWTLIAHARIDDFSRLSFATEMQLLPR
jgi:copper transport protein